MWIRNADRFAFIFKDEHVIDFFAVAKLAVLLLPNCKQVLDLARFKFSERQTVVWAVTHDASNSARGLIAINPGRTLQSLRRIETDARMIVIKDEGTSVIVIFYATDAQDPGTQIAISHICRQRPLIVLNRRATTGAIRTMRRDDYPLLSQRMPTLFPVHSLFTRSPST